jgi:predicted Na+-dependent transporter
MPDEDRGVALVVLLANALAVTFLNAVLAGLVARSVRRSWRNRQLGLVGALRAASLTPILAVAAAMACYQQAFKRLVLPAMERRGLVVPHDDRPAAEPQ